VQTIEELSNLRNGPGKNSNGKRKMKKQLFGLVLACALASLPTWTQAQKGKPQDVRLFIKDAETSEDLNGVEYSVLSPDSTDGELEENSTFTDLIVTHKYPVGTQLVISIFRSGYYSDKVTLRVDSLPRNNMQYINLRPLEKGPEPRFIVEGTLRYPKKASNGPIKNEIVRVYGLHQEIRDTTDEVGHFRFEIKQSEITAMDQGIKLFFGAEGNRYKAKDTIIHPTQNMKVIKVMLEKNRTEFSLDFKLFVKKDHDIIPHAKVSLFQGGIQIGTSTANINGRVILAGERDPSSGNLVIIIEGRGMPPTKLIVPESALKNPKLLQTQVHTTLSHVHFPKMGEIVVGYGVGQTMSNGAFNLELLAGLGNIRRVLVGVAWRPSFATEENIRGLPVQLYRPKIWQSLFELEAKYHFAPVMMSRTNGNIGAALSFQPTSIGSNTKILLGQRYMLGLQYSIVEGLGIGLDMWYNRTKWMIPNQLLPISKGGFTINAHANFLFNW
jgi:hypothetical protein